MATQPNQGRMAGRHWDPNQYLKFEDHRLRPALAQIDDLQPPVAEGDPALCNDAFAIRPPWRLPGRHPGNRAGICRASIKGKLAAQTAHISMNSPGLFEAHRPMRAAPG